MALSKAGLKSRIESELVSQGFIITGVYEFGSKLATAIANAVIDEIQANARCSGTDSGNDSHGNVQIT